MAHAMQVVTGADAAAIERRVAEFEARTGVEIVAAVERRSDLYPEVPWRAFALGASLASLGVAGRRPAAGRAGRRRVRCSRRP